MISRGLHRDAILSQIDSERIMQNAKWGEQNHPIIDAKHAKCNKVMAEMMKEACERAAKRGDLSFQHILLEEVYEALAEDTPERQREELIQVAAVAVQMIERIDRMGKP